MMKMRGRLAICAVAGMSMALPGLAQDMRSASEKVVACQTVIDPVERLACFETAAAELSTLLETPIAEAPAPSVPVTPTTAPAPAVPTAPVEQAVVTTPAAPVPAPAPTVTATAESTDAPIQQAEATTTDADDGPRSRLPSWIPRVTFGGGRDVEKEPDEFATQLTRIQVNRLGRHFFTTAEGHVWRQKSPEDIRAPKDLPADVVIYQNITGGLRLKIVETNRSYPVRRVE
jgi:hypothetical protein